MEEINKYEIFKELKLNQSFIENVTLFYVFKVYSTKEKTFKTNVIVVTKDDETFVFGDNSEGNLGSRFNYWGLLGFGHENEIKLIQNEDLSKKKIIDFKNGWNDVIARTVDGKVYCWDRNYKPKLNQSLSDKNVIDISCGNWHSLVLTNEGQVYAWGWNYYGQIGDGSNESVSILFHVNKFNREKVKAIACGARHSMALTEKGNVFSWGSNNYGQLGFKNLKGLDSVNAPKQIEISEFFEKISCGQDHSLLLSHDGDIYVFGSNHAGQLGDETITGKSETPLKLKSENKFIDIASHCKYRISMALSMKGKIFIWGYCGNAVIKTPIETQFKSFNGVFAHYEHITYKTIVIDKIFGNGIYSQVFTESKVIGSGSFGIVSEARNRINNKSFVIKKIPINLMTCERVTKEVDILSQLKSDFVVKLKSFWTEDNYIKTNGYNKYENLSSGHVVFNPQNSLLLHIQMELCSFTLKDAISKLNNELNHKPLETMNSVGYYIASELFVEILEAVKFLHELNPPVTHRDLKLSNIMITNRSNGRFIKLADFGLAKIHEFDGKSHTKYAAPEVMRGTNYDSKSDIYSLGFILQDLFNIDINDPIGENTELETKYSYLFDLTERIFAPTKNKRPSCKQILSDRNMWTLSSDELMRDKHIENILNEIKTIEESFHLYFVQTKLKTRYVREFKELEMIGSGSFGKVFKVFNLFDEQNYAMKKILLTEFSDELKEQSSKQLKLMTKLQSDHVVQYKNSWIENNEILYIQMELCFSTLKDILLKKRNEFQRQEFQPMSRLEYYVSGELFKEILEAVNFLHEQNPPIIHRDLKPTNILITSGINGRFIKLADFGLALVHKFDEQTHTQGLGTIKYTAPEVLAGRSYDLKTDIYSLGSVAQRVFDIDIYSFSDDSITDPLLNEKYLAIYKIIGGMVSPMKNLRPNCNQILREKNSWVLDIKKVENDFIQLSSTEQPIEDNFHKYFIKTKIKALNRSISVSRFVTETIVG